MWQEAIEVFRKVGDTEGLAASSNNVGDVLLTRGKLDEARKLLEQAMVGYRLTGDRVGVALAMADLGQIALQKADLPTAKSHYEQAVAIATLTADKSATAYGVAGLGDVFMEQDQLNGARKQYEMALALARLAIEADHPQDAEPEARECLNQLHHEQLPDDEIGAGLVLADALLNLSKDADAKKELVALRPIEEKTQNRELQLRFSLEFAKALSAEHHLSSPRTLLDTVLRRQKQLDLRESSWRHIGPGQGAGGIGDVPGATHQLKLVEARERSTGFLLLARKADATTRLWSNPGK